MTKIVRGKGFRGAAAAAALLVACALFLASALPFGQWTQPRQTDAYQGEVRTFSLPQSNFPTGDINVNTADVKALDTLPGVGPKLAQAIIDAREQSGPFVYPEDLLTVPGIGKKTLENIRPLIRMGD